MAQQFHPWIDVTRHFSPKPIKKHVWGFHHSDVRNDRRWKKLGWVSLGNGKTKFVACGVMQHLGEREIVIQSFWQDPKNMVWVKKQNKLYAQNWLSELKYPCVQSNIHFARAHATEKRHFSSIAWLSMPKKRKTERRENGREQSQREAQKCVNYSALPLHLRGKIFIHIPNYFIEWVPEIDDFTSFSNYDEDGKAAGFRGLEKALEQRTLTNNFWAWSLGPFPFSPRAEAQQPGAHFSRLIPGWAKR